MEWNTTNRHIDKKYTGISIFLCTQVKGSSICLVLISSRAFPPIVKFGTPYRESNSRASKTMTLFIQGTPWLLASFSLLTATISNIIKPSGHQTFIEDAMFNILSFSPFQSGRDVLSLVVYLIHLRLLNIAGIHTSLRLLSCHAFPTELSGIRRGFWPLFARFAFFIGATLPLYATLLASTSYLWLQVFTTFLVAESVLAELLRFYEDSVHDGGFTVRRGWPRSMLIMNPLVTTNHPFHRPVAPPSASKDNLCDRIQQLWSIEADTDIAFTIYPLHPEYEAKLDGIFSLKVRPAPWSCRHWRCLVYIISRAAIRIFGFSWYIELASTTWLLHIDLHPVTLQISDQVLENDLAGGLLTLFYHISYLLTVVVSAVIFSNLLFIRLGKQGWIKQRFQDLAGSIPITNKTLQAVGRHFIMPKVLALVFHRFLGPEDWELTPQMVSIAMEIVVILIIYIIGYRLLFCPKSNHQEPQALHETFSKDKKKPPNGGTEYPKGMRPGVRFQVFRLTIWTPTVIVWIYFHYWCGGRSHG